MGASALLDRFPGLEARLPVASLGRFPTPVQEARGLGSGLGAALWIKRDDRSGGPYGGNKVRKLELVLARARADGRRRVVTAGAYGSHHVLATCLFASRLGLSPTAVLCPQPVTDHVLHNLLATGGTGAEIVTVNSFAAAGPRLVYEAARRRAMLIPPGGSSPLGALSFVGAAYELAAQIARGQCPTPTRIYLALGSSGTMAGLVLGVRLAAVSTEVVGVRVTPLAVANELTVATLATRASALLHRLAPSAPRLIVAPSEVTVLHDQIGDGYGHPTDAARRALRLAEDRAGLGLDLTYTAKALAGLISDVHARPPRGPVLFWSTLSSTDLRPLLAGVGPEVLPASLQRLFQGREVR